eukprot:CAMPEP_0198516658 /NCGR_PEP_ID=MMETSP1462-20131121/18046_1 /TAXON_ID=1333877 /ORGANISM="Brandtodinium nutriculum, Strain RCC3387" /LENGTH=564 /DNA_ID=CAMNT_0044246189 /DNA_START=11 /DNA_END=1705 /DNA_ORIENTATION=-
MPSFFLALAFACGVSMGCAAGSDGGDACRSESEACWSRIDFSRPEHLLMQPGGQITLLGFLVLCAIVLLTPLCGRGFMTVITVLSSNVFVLCLPFVPDRTNEFGKCGLFQHEQGLDDGVLGWLNSGPTMGCMAMVSIPILSRLQLAASPSREPSPWCRGLVIGSCVLFWAWLISVDYCVRQGPLLGDSLFVACIASLIANVALQLRRGVAPQRYLQACLLGLVVSAWSTVVCDAHEVFRSAPVAWPLVKYYAQGVGLVFMSWLAVAREVLAEGPWEPTPIAQHSGGSHVASTYMPIQEEVGHAFETPQTDQAWDLYWNLSGAIVPVAVIFAMPWLAHVGWAQYPPLMPHDYPKLVEVTKISLSGYIDAPPCMAMYAAAMSYVFVNFWRYLDLDILPGTLSQQSLGLTAKDMPSERLLHYRVHLPGRLCFLLYFEMFFGLFMTLTYSWQPLPHRYFTAVFGTCAAVLIFWVMRADRRLRSTWRMPGLFAGAVLTFLAVMVLGIFYGDKPRLPDCLLLPYPWSPTDDNLFWLIEAISMSLTCLIAPLASSIVDRQGGHARVADAKV